MVYVNGDGSAARRGCFHHLQDFELDNQTFLFTKVKKGGEGGVPFHSRERVASGRSRKGEKEGELSQEQIGVASTQRVHSHGPGGEGSVTSCADGSCDS